MTSQGECLRLFRILCTCVVVGSVQGGANCHGLETADGDAYCGPRCTHFVLAQYGIQSNLYDLASQLAEPEGASLSRIKLALESNGLFTYAFEVGNDVAIDWPHPVIVHLRGKNHGGHYVVQLPSSQTGKARLWLGLEGEVIVPTETLSGSRSGAVLLTSPSRIENPELAFRNANRLDGSLSWLLVASTFTLAMSQLVFRRIHVPRLT
jgi:ABC-type bacteriocin/lantibiotic exporter with double-glycine peptidase domain